MISSHLKEIAKDLNIPVVVLSQLSRPQKGAENRKPVLSDLRESGAIEQDADVVVFIHREEVGKNSDGKPIFKHELDVAKQRNGPIGDFPIKFEHWCTRFESIKKEAENGTE
jgi:replicative DNA helicase